MTPAVRAWKHADEMKVDVFERKLTSGMLMISGTVVRHWSRTQATRALSTAEAEYYAVIRGAAEELGLQSMMTDLGPSAHNAAKSIATRRGLGKTRNIELKYLWLLEVITSGRVNMRRVPGE